MDSVKLKALVPLDLDPHQLHRQRGRLEAVEQFGACGTLFPGGLAQPRVERLAEFRQHRAYRTRLDLHEIKILGVAPRRIEVELVKLSTP